MIFGNYLFISINNKQTETSDWEIISNAHSVLTPRYSACDSIILIDLLFRQGLAEIPISLNPMPKFKI